MWLFLCALWQSIITQYFRIDFDRTDVLTRVPFETAQKENISYRVNRWKSSRRYKFLAFDFYENVEVTKENCRLLLIRLKMEGWLIGKSKVFLRYYNEEYLSRYVYNNTSCCTLFVETNTTTKQTNLLGNFYFSQKKSTTHPWPRMTG
jgi:hypothetical protein